MTSRDTGPSVAANVARLFDGSRLTLARQLAGLRKTGLADRIGKTPTAVASYENGTKRPAAATVAQLALALGVDAEFFLPGPALETSVPHFRSLRSTTQVARDQANAYGRLVAAAADSLERHVEFPDVDIPRIPLEESFSSDGPGPDDAARALRESWGLGTGPIRHLVRSAENHGVLVVFSPGQTAAVDAYSLESTDRPVVLLNPIKLDYHRQRFDTAHEIGHLVMHPDAEPGLRWVEDQAHRFAAELLMPASEITPLLPRKADWRVLARLKEEWGVSMQALLFRARRLSVMSESTYRNAMTTLSARGWRRQEPGNRVEVEQPSLLPAAVELLAGSGITIEDQRRECAIPMDLFSTMTARRPSATTS